MTNNVFQTAFKLQNSATATNYQKSSVYSAINTQKSQYNSIFSKSVGKTTQQSAYYKPLGSQNTQPYFSYKPQVQKGGMGFRKDIPQIKQRPLPLAPHHHNNFWGNNINSNNNYVYNNVNINIFNGYC